MLQLAARAAAPRARRRSSSPERSRRARSRWSTSPTSSACRCCELPALQRELSPRADAAAIRELRAILRERRPDVLHTHTAKAGATGRIAALLRAAGGRRRSSTPTTATCSAGTSRRGGSASSGWIERVLARATGALVAVSDEVRDDLVGFGVAPAERFAVVPYGFDLPPWSAADDDARARHPGRARARRRDVRRRVGRPADRDQAPARPRSHASRASRRGRRRGARAGRRRRGPRAETEALAGELGVAERCRFAGFQQPIRALVRGLRCVAADVGQRRDPRRRDRVARGRAAGRGHARGRHRRRRHRRRERLPACRRRHRRRWRGASPSSPATRSCASARPTRRRGRPQRASRPPGWPTSSRASTGSCSA